MGKSQYKIQFGGLSMGEHQFEFDIKGKFFEQFSESEITEADIQVKANLVKQNTLMHILFTFEGTVKLSCDRCLVDYNCPIFGQEKLVIKHGNPEESNDEILVLKEGLMKPTLHNIYSNTSNYLYQVVKCLAKMKRMI
jgi:uncharacterized protein